MLTSMRKCSIIQIKKQEKGEYYGSTKIVQSWSSMVKSNVRNAMLHYDICHRSLEFEQMFKDTQEKIKQLFRADDTYYSLIVSGSGTSANEIVLSSLFQGEEAVLLIRNGEFGQRLLEIIDKYQVPKVEVVFSWGIYPDLRIIEELSPRIHKLKSLPWYTTKPAQA